MKSRVFSFVHRRVVFSAALSLSLLVLLTASQAQTVSAHGLEIGRQKGYVQMRPVALSDNAIAIDAGWYHSCAVTRAGGVKCWGANYYGMLGDGSLTASSVPVDVANLTGATAVAAGTYHTCAVTASGMKCWGANYHGQLGDGTTDPSSAPVNVSGLVSRPIAIGLGRDFSCAVTAGGGVQCWGLNSAGQLGDNTTNTSHVPVAVYQLTSGATAIALGTRHACALVGGGAKCWGDNNYGQLGNNTKTNSPFPVDVIGLAGAISIAASDSHNCAVISGGTLKCWGSAYGKVPMEVSGLNGVTAVAVGNSFTCVLIAGVAKCGGVNDVGQLGDGSVTDTLSPVPVVGLGSAVAISAGYAHACALTVGGTVECWGSDQDGRLGIGEWTYQSTPIDVSGITDTNNLGASGYHTCAVVDPAATVQCWGYNRHGELGNDSKTYSNIPVDVIGLGGVSAVAPGTFHTCALLNNMEVKCWGLNGAGQLGNGTYTQSLVPVPVTGLTGASAIASGNSHTCALVSGGVRCWGDNARGQLGDGSNTRSNVPVDVAGLKGAVSSIAVGSYHTCALIVDGTVQCWGYNSYGELGNDSSQNSNQPVDVGGGLSGVSGIIAGGDHTCAGVGTGAKCWGRNDSGQLGNGNYANSRLPVDVSGLSGTFVTAAAGGEHTCVVMSGGLGSVTVKCWGNNSAGQLGNGSTARSNVPVIVTGLSSGIGTTIPRIAAGDYHTCAQTSNLISGPKLKCWGSHVYGQLGNGVFGFKTTSASVVGFVEAYFSFLPGVRK